MSSRSPRIWQPDVSCFSRRYFPRRASSESPLCPLDGVSTGERLTRSIRAYKSVNTDVMNWVMTRVSGQSFTQLLHERLWAPLGCEEDLYVVVDAAGFPMAGGGLS